MGAGAGLVAPATGGRCPGRRRSPREQRNLPGMTLDLADLFPRANAWATAQSDAALNGGAALSPAGVELARSVGVQLPQQVRIVIVDALPVPDDPVLLEAATQAGLLRPDAVGLTLGHAIIVRRGHEADTRLLRHELRHVAQVEFAGSLTEFLREYLRQVIAYGYRDAPWEVDARAQERPC